MTNPYEVTVRFDWENPMVRAWFADLLMRIKHPMYEGKIEVLPPAPAALEEVPNGA